VSGEQKELGAKETHTQIHTQQDIIPEPTIASAGCATNGAGQINNCVNFPDGISQRELILAPAGLACTFATPGEIIHCILIGISVWLAFGCVKRKYEFIFLNITLSEFDKVVFIANENIFLKFKSIYICIFKISRKVLFSSVM